MRENLLGSWLCAGCAEWGEKDVYVRIEDGGVVFSTACDRNWRAEVAEVPRVLRCELRNNGKVIHGSPRLTASTPSLVAEVINPAGDRLLWKIHVSGSSPWRHEWACLADVYTCEPDPVSPTLLHSPRRGPDADPRSSHKQAGAGPSCNYTRCSSYTLTDTPPAALPPPAAVLPTVTSQQPNPKPGGRSPPAPRPRGDRLQGWFQLSDPLLAVEQDGGWRVVGVCGERTPAESKGPSATPFDAVFAGFVRPSAASEATRAPQAGHPAPHPPSRPVVPPPARYSVFLRCPVPAQADQKPKKQLPATPQNRDPPRTPPRRPSDAAAAEQAPSHAAAASAPLDPQVDVGSPAAKAALPSHAAAARPEQSEPNAFPSHAAAAAATAAPPHPQVDIDSHSEKPASPSHVAAAAQPEQSGPNASPSHAAAAAAATSAPQVDIGKAALQSHAAAQPEQTGRSASLSHAASSAAAPPDPQVDTGSPSAKAAHPSHAAGSGPRVSCMGGGAPAAPPLKPQAQRQSHVSNFQWVEASAVDASQTSSSSVTFEFAGKQCALWAPWRGRLDPVGEALESVDGGCNQGQAIASTPNGRTVGLLQVHGYEPKASPRGRQTAVKRSASPDGSLKHSATGLKGESSKIAASASGSSETNNARPWGAGAQAKPSAARPRPFTTALLALRPPSSDAGGALSKSLTAVPAGAARRPGPKSGGRGVVSDTPAGPPVGADGEASGGLMPRAPPTFFVGQHPRRHILKATGGILRNDRCTTEHLYGKPRKPHVPRSLTAKEKKKLLLEQGFSNSAGRMATD
eukprot:gene15770-24088_t